MDMKEVERFEASTVVTSEPVVRLPIPRPIDGADYKGLADAIRAGCKLTRPLEKRWFVVDLEKVRVRIAAPKVLKATVVAEIRDEYRPAGLRACTLSAAAIGSGLVNLDGAMRHPYEFGQMVTHLVMSKFGIPAVLTHRIVEMNDDLGMPRESIANWVEHEAAQWVRDR